MTKSTPPSQLATWFAWVGDSCPTIPHNPVSVITKSTDKILYHPHAGDADWLDVAYWTFGDHRL